MYDASSIKVLSEQESIAHSPFGMAAYLSSKYPDLDIAHIQKIAEACFIAGIPISLYERRYCSPLNSVASDASFTQKELNTLDSLVSVFKELSLKERNKQRLI